MLTAIIPIDLKRRPKELIKRAISLAENAHHHNVKTIFGHNDRETRYDKKLKYLIGSVPSAQIVSSINTSEGINSSLLRNIAFSKVDSNYIILLDADIHPDFKLFNKYKEKLKREESPFYILPCLYLTEYGSNILNKNIISTEDAKNKYFSFSRKEFLHLASPSSITILKSSDYAKLDGFNTNYQGHGYEDFDFLLRLSELHFASGKDYDFLIDKTARSPLFATGFKKYLGEFCIESLLAKDFAFHLYHTKDSKENYYSSRKDNYQKFVSLHQHKVSNGQQADPTLITTFIKRCHDNDLSIHEYSILFENKPGHIDRYDTLKRKIQFLFRK